MAFKKKWNNQTQCKTYFAWRSMRSRCSNPKDPSYANYGARGIKVCERWADDYDAFFEDMGKAPDGLSLDRIDVNGDYEPSNCRWVDWKAQANNKRSNALISFAGKTQTVAMWASEIRVKYDTLWKRLFLHNMPMERALSSGVLTPEWQHGTRTGYRTGCGCRPCKDAHAAYHRELRARRKQRKQAALAAEVAKE